MPVRCVCFDLGGVLVRIAQTWGDAALAASVFIARGHLSTPLVQFSGLESFQRGALSGDEYLASLMDYLAVVSPEEAMAVHLAILREPYAGTLELVQDLESDSILTACLSNTNEPHWEAMSGSGRFPNIARLQNAALSHRLGLEKPQPEIYLALERMVSVRGEEIAFFDDSIANVEAARTLGWNAEHIDPHGDPADQMRVALTRLGVLSG